jgi:hypothetical protein
VKIVEEEVRLSVLKKAELKVEQGEKPGPTAFK